MLPFEIIWAHTFHSVKLFVNFFVRNFHKFLSWMLFWLLLNSYLFHASLFLLLLLYFQSLFYDQSVICYWICSNIIAMFSSQALQALGGVFSILPQSLVSCLFSLCHRFMSPNCPYLSFVLLIYRDDAFSLCLHSCWIRTHFYKSIGQSVLLFQIFLDLTLEAKNFNTNAVCLGDQVSWIRNTFWKIS